MSKHRSENLNHYQHTQNLYFLFWASLIFGLMTSSLLPWLRYSANNNNAVGGVQNQDGLLQANFITQGSSYSLGTLMPFLVASLSARQVGNTPNLLSSLALTLLFNPFPAQAQLAAPYSINLTTTQLGKTTFINAEGQTRVAYIPDINGDTLPEILIGVPQANPPGRAGAGKTYLIWGNRSLGNIFDLAKWNMLNAGIRFDGAVADDFSGNSIASIPDINGDSLPEILIGANQASPQGRRYAGSTYLIWGNRSLGSVVDLANWSTLNAGVRFDGATAGDHSGYSVASVPDINGDTLPEILIGAFQALLQGRTQAGGTYLIWGNRNLGNVVDLSNWSTLNVGIRFDGAAAYENNGVAVASTPDINGDTVPEIVIGAYGAAPQGRSIAGSTYLIWGNRNLASIIDLSNWSTLNAGIRFDGAVAGHFSGWSVASSPDINGDTFAEILIGAYSASPQGRGGAGSTYLIWGNRNLANVIDLANWSTLSIGIRFDGAIAGDNSGISIASTPDINGDALPEILIGAFYTFQQGRTIAGSTYLIWGNRNLGNIVDLANWSMLNAGIRFDGFGGSGQSVTSTPDISGDGRTEILVGSGGGSPYFILSETFGFPGTLKTSSLSTTRVTTTTQTSAPSTAMTTPATTSTAMTTPATTSTKITTKMPTSTTLSLVSTPSATQIRTTTSSPTTPSITMPPSSVINSAVASTILSTSTAALNSGVTSSGNTMPTQITATISGSTIDNKNSSTNAENTISSINTSNNTTALTTSKDTPILLTTLLPATSTGLPLSAESSNVIPTSSTLSPEKSGNTDTLSTPVIISGVVGGVVLLTAALAACGFWQKKRKSTSANHLALRSMSDEQSNNATNPSIQSNNPSAAAISPYHKIDEFKATQRQYDDAPAAMTDLKRLP